MVESACKEPVLQMRFESWQAWWITSRPHLHAAAEGSQSPLSCDSPTLSIQHSLRPCLYCAKFVLHPDDLLVCICVCIIICRMLLFTFCQCVFGLPLHDLLRTWSEHGVWKHISSVPLQSPELSFAVESMNHLPIQFCIPFQFWQTVWFASLGNLGDVSQTWAQKNRYHFDLVTPSATQLRNRWCLQAELLTKRG